MGPRLRMLCCRPSLEASRRQEACRSCWRLDLRDRRQSQHTPLPHKHDFQLQTHFPCQEQRRVLHRTRPRNNRPCLPKAQPSLEHPWGGHCSHTEPLWSKRTIRKLIEKQYNGYGRTREFFQMHAIGEVLCVLIDLRFVGKPSMRRMLCRYKWRQLHLIDINEGHLLKAQHA